MTHDILRCINILTYLLKGIICFHPATVNNDVADWHAGVLESLSATVAHPSLPAIEEEIASVVGGDEDTEARQMRAVAVAVLAVLQSLDKVRPLSLSLSLSHPCSQPAVGEF